MVLDYLSFGDEWRKEVSKMPINLIKQLFPVPISDNSRPRRKKSEWIDRLRGQLIVKQFNEQFPVGSTLWWKPVANDETEPILVTVKREAYVAASLEPVCFFHERSGYCSISPEFVVLHHPSGQFDFFEKEDRSLREL